MLYGIYDVKPGICAEKIESDILEALNAGLQWLQIRDKQLDQKLWPLWASISCLMAAEQKQLIINDQVELVQQLIQKHQGRENDRPGIHLGQSDTPLKKARACLPQGTTIGITCHNSLSLAQQATHNGASYVAFGRFFPSTTKPDASPAEIDTLLNYKKWAVQDSHKNKPKIAVIGGITDKTVPALLQSPADLFAVSQGIWNDESSISTAIESLQHSLHQRPTSPWSA